MLDKVWKIIDDNEKTGKYHQIKSKLIDKDNGVCINGLIMAYTANIKAEDMKRPDKIDYIENLFEKHTMSKFQIGNNTNYDIEMTMGMTEQEIVDKIKQLAKENKSIDNVLLASLNNSGWTFPQLRDLLKELDI